VISKKKAHVKGSGETDGSWRSSMQKKRRAGGGRKFLSRHSGKRRHLSDKAEQLLLIIDMLLFSMSILRALYK